MPKYVIDWPASGLRVHFFRMTSSLDIAVAFQEQESKTKGLRDVIACSWIVEGHSIHDAITTLLEKVLGRADAPFAPMTHQSVLQKAPCKAQWSESNSMTC